VSEPSREPYDLFRLVWCNASMGRVRTETHGLITVH
jgi:hypothetical protein